MKAAAATMTTVLLVVAGCTSGGNGDTASGLPVIVQGYDDPSLPYGIVAIDYHFHDAHPSIPLDPSRDVTFSNQGSVKHNVSRWVAVDGGMSDNLRPMLYGAAYEAHVADRFDGETPCVLAG